MAIFPRNDIFFETPCIYLLSIFIDTYIDDGSGKREYDGQEPDEDGDLLGLGGGAEILRLHGVHHRVVSTTIYHSVHS